jgi:signal transduction histidine kinase
LSEPPAELGAAEAVHWAVEEALVRERARLARDLHDNVASDLAGAIALFKHQLESNPEDAALRSLEQVLESILASTRELLRELRPDERLAERSLVDELERTADEFGRLYGIRVEIWTNGSESDLSRAQREVVFQIVRESLTNVRRHSGSSTCRVRLVLAARPFLVEVSDEGAGIPADVPAGYGLIGMRERAAGISGRLEVVSAPGQGTTIFLFGPETVTAI